MSRFGAPMAKAARDYPEELIELRRRAVTTGSIIVRTEVLKGMERTKLTEQPLPSAATRDFPATTGCI